MAKRRPDKNQASAGKTPSRGDRSRKGSRHPQAQAVVVRLTEPAFNDLKDLLRADPQIVRWALKKMIHLEKNPEAGELLHGALIGWRKLVVGDRDWRVVWRVTHDQHDTIIVDVAEVWAIGARSDGAVYAEMTERAKNLPSGPRTLALAEVIERLGKAGSGLTAQGEAPSTSDLPDWLIDRLVEQAGLPAETVAQLTLEQAFDAWTAWANRDVSRETGPEKSR